jgi:hypothetical protein
VTKAVECLLSKHKVLSSNPVSPKIKKKEYKVLIIVITELLSHGLFLRKNISFLYLFTLSKFPMKACAITEN